MTPVTIPSRDGLDLHSYLTLPVGSSRPGAADGPAGARRTVGARRLGCTHPAVQLLANRGYAVLQVNFRGSTGYGKAFMKAAIGEFAGKMHDDLIDAVDWAVDAGATRTRTGVAIFGGSYGGYAALVGVTFTPDVFAAAIDYVGISSLVNFMRHAARHRPPAPGQQLAPVRRQPGRPGAGGRHAGSLADHPGGPDPHAAAGGPGRQRRPRRAGRVRQPRRGAARPRRRGRVHGQGGRGPRVRQPGQRDRHVQRRRPIPGKAPRKGGDS